MDNEKVYNMSFSKVYVCLVNKALRKNKSENEVLDIIYCLTGYSKEEISNILDKNITYKEFFNNAPDMNPNRFNINGSICGIKIEDIKEPLMKEIRYLDKLIDDLAKGKSVKSIIDKYSL